MGPGEKGQIVGRGGAQRDMRESQRIGLPDPKGSLPHPALEDQVLDASERG